jgi:hypothetical protein
VFALSGGLALRSPVLSGCVGFWFELGRHRQSAFPTRPHITAASRSRLHIYES